MDLSPSPSWLCLSTFVTADPLSLIASFRVTWPWAQGTHSLLSSNSKIYVLFPSLLRPIRSTRNSPARHHAAFSQSMTRSSTKMKENTGLCNHTFNATSQGCHFSRMDHPPQPQRHQLPASRSIAARETILLSCIMGMSQHTVPESIARVIVGTIHPRQPQSALRPRSRMRSFYCASYWVALMHDTSSDRTLWRFKTLPYGFVLDSVMQVLRCVQNVQCIEPSRSCLQEE